MLSSNEKILRNGESKVSWRAIATLAIVVVTAASGALMSCSAVDNSLTDTFLIGDTTNANYQASSSTIEQFALEGDVYSYPNLFSAELGEGSFVPQFGPRRSPSVGPADTILSFTLVVDSIGWWYIFTAEIKHGNDTAAVVDSLQFRTGGLPRPVNDNDTIHEVRSHAHFRVTAHPDVTPVLKATSGARHEMFEGVWSGYHLLSVNGVHTPQFTLNLLGADSVLGSASDDSARTCDINLAVNKTITNLVVDTANGDCPLSGTVTAAGTLTLGCTGPNGTLSFGGAWTISAVFSGATQNITFTNGNTRWEVTRSCPEAPAMSTTPLGSLSALVANN